jgi:hypothetical protein
MRSPFGHMRSAPAFGYGAGIRDAGASPYINNIPDLEYSLTRPRLVRAAEPAEYGGKFTVTYLLVALQRLVSRKARPSSQVQCDVRNKVISTR